MNIVRTMLTPRSRLALLLPAVLLPACTEDNATTEGSASTSAAASTGSGTDAVTTGQGSTGVPTTSGSPTSEPGSSSSTSDATTGPVTATTGPGTTTDQTTSTTSNTSTTGQPIRRAISALAPLPVSPGLATPSNRPIDPSASTSAASSACAATSLPRAPS